MKRDEVLETAQQIINGPRRDAYGGVEESFAAIADGWSRILGVSVSARQVALAMVWLKVVRESNAHGDDNLIDIAGYAALAGELS